MNGGIQLAKRMSRVQASAIREILKITERPDVLSFAGGLPAPEAFPVEAMARAHAEVLAHDGSAALQYGATEGFGPLRDWVADRMTRRGLPARPEQVLITTGSQQGIDLTGKALIDPGDVIIVEAPSYLAALQSFGTYEAQFAVVGSDDEGMRVDVLASLLAGGLRPKIVYTIPDYQNPTGLSMSADRRSPSPDADPSAGFRRWTSCSRAITLGSRPALTVLAVIACRALLAKNQLNRRGS